jgi:acetyl-CoA/propionyl-CoA carboxylase biotin carboxyl carrier protein
VSIKKVLIANRGEIAIRVMRACRELGIASVAVYSEADRFAAHVAAADEAMFIGQAAAAQSYLDIEKILGAAARTGCDAVHPGYGFLAENAGFAARCTDAGLSFVGPSAAAIKRMGDKISARAVAHEAGVPVVPGTIEPVSGPDAVRDWAEHVGYPIAIKASAGGGGKGMKLARGPGDVDTAFSLASKEAVAYFGDGTLYVERYLERPKHVEVQVLGDKHGNVLHLGERDCSLQRRHQKVVEETPARILPTVRQRLHAAAVKLAAAIGYDSAGTIECLVDGDEFYFLEMNTRIQVEHTVTEATYGVDLVKAQIRIAAGEPLWFTQGQLTARGHAIEVRVNAETPTADFRPCPGTITRYVEPGGPGVRVDSGVFKGWTIPESYDSLLAKLVVWGQDRSEAIARLRRALAEFRVEGVDTTIPFAALLLDDDEFKRGDYTTPTIERFMRERGSAVAAAYEDRAAGTDGSLTAAESGPPREIAVEVDDKRFSVRVFGLTDAAPTKRSPVVTRRSPAHDARSKAGSADGEHVISPMHGVIAQLRVAAGDAVADNQVVAIVEAMKMMNEIVSPRAGRVRSVNVTIGETIESGAPIVTFDDRAGA